MNNTNIIDDITSVKKSIYNTLCDCIFQISEDVNAIKSEYNSDLLELITVLKSNQDDVTFIHDEGIAFAKYLKSKGCTNQDAKLVTSGIIKYFD